MSTGKPVQKEVEPAPQKLLVKEPEAALMIGESGNPNASALSLVLRLSCFLVDRSSK